MGLIQKFKKADEILDEKLETLGYFTPEDIKSAGFSQTFVSFVVFFMKRDSDYSFFYLDSKGERFESKYDLPKKERSSLTLCFQPRTETNYCIR